MKLKHDTHAPASVLTLLPEGSADADALQLRHAQVVKAGLARWIAAGSHQFVIDISAVQASPEVQSAFLEIQDWSPHPSSFPQILICADFGPVQSVNEGLAALSAGTAPLVLQEFKLKKRMAQLEVLKARAAERLAKLEGNPQSKRVREIRLSLGQKRKELRMLASALERWETLGVLPSAPLAPRSGTTPEVEQVLVSHFKKQKIFQSLKAPQDAGESA